MKRMVLGSLGCIALAAVVVATAPASRAADDKAAIEARKAIMKQVGANAQEIGKFTKGESRESVADIGKRADTIAELARKATEAFKQKTEAVPGVETTAKPEIWADWNKFAELMGNMEKAAGGVSAAAASGSEAAVKTAATDMGKACGACHSNFRVRKS